MSRLELDPAQLAWAMNRAKISRAEVENQLTRYVAWRRQHRLRGEWYEGWLLWVDIVAVDRDARNRREHVPEWSAESLALSAAEREHGLRGVAAARERLTRRSSSEQSATESEVF